MEKHHARRAQRSAAASTARASVGGEHADFVARAREAWDAAPTAPGPLKGLGYSDGVKGLGGKTALPAGATRTVHHKWEQWDVPPPTAEKIAESQRRAGGNVRGNQPRVPVTTLPAYAQTVLAPVTHLNRLQSAVYPAAFESSENLVRPVDKRRLLLLS